MLNVAEVAVRLGVSEALVCRWIASGMLPHVKFRGGCVSVDPDELAGFAVGIGLAALVPQRKEMTAGS